jgi:hypothetical protein
VTVIINGEEKEVPGALTREEVLGLLESVRKEEKDKLYATQEEQRQKIAQLERDAAARAEAELAEQQRLAAEEQARLDAERTETERLAEQQRILTEEIAALRQENETERALRQKEAEYAQLAGYRFQRLEQMGDAIAPQFRDLVHGNTPEEIELSLWDMAVRTESIASEFQEVMAAQGLQMRREQAPAVTGQPSNEGGTGAVNDQRQATLSPQDIANLSPAEYEQLRPQLLQAASQRVQQGGAYAP